MSTPGSSEYAHDDPSAYGSTAPGFAQPAYGQPVVVAPAYAPAPQTSGLAIASMICSIIGLGLVGAILGHAALGDCTRRGDRSGRTMALVGIWLGWGQLALGIIVFIVAIVLNLAVFGVVAGSSGH